MIDSQAYVLRDSGTLPELEDIQVSGELELGQILAEVRFTSLCGTQLEEIFTSSRNKRYMPHLFGHEASAEVIAVGPGVTKIIPGENVVIHWRESSLGLDANPGKYWSHGEKINAGKVVTLSKYVVVPENRVTALPSGVEMWAAPLLGCSLTTGWGSVMKTGGLQHGEVTLVIGLGGVGRASVLAGSGQGHGVVYAVDPRTMDQLDLANLGVRQKFNSLDQVFEQIRGNVLPYPDLVVDTVGIAQDFELLLRELPNTSRVVLVGMPRPGARPALDTQRLLDGLRILGSNGGDVDPGLDLLMASRWVRGYLSGTGSGQTTVLGWKALSEGINAITNKAATKVIYEVS
jgi:S-(hydroxymethyl)glutathione dehydrogenase / alcohol dehydrogenase